MYNTACYDDCKLLFGFVTSHCQYCQPLKPSAILLVSVPELRINSFVYVWTLGTWLVHPLHPTYTHHTRHLTLGGPFCESVHNH